MISIHYFTFNPFAENTYLLIDSENKALLVDPGMYNRMEQHEFREYLTRKELILERVLLTHAHLDHLFGLKFIHREFGLLPMLNKEDAFIYRSAESSAMMYGVQMESLPDVEYGLDGGSGIDFGGETLDVVHTPGHSPGSVSFISHRHRFIIAGDVLFKGSIGRTDLPGGDYQTLINSIKTNYMTLADDYKVYSGHGPVTSIGAERLHNPFLQD